MKFKILFLFLLCAALPGFSQTVVIGGQSSGTVTGTGSNGQGTYFSDIGVITGSTNWQYSSATGHTVIQGADGADAFHLIRATDTGTPTGNFIRAFKADNSTVLFSLDILGNVVAAGALTTNGGTNLCGSSAPCLGGTEGATQPTAAANQDFIHFNSTAHCVQISNNNGTFTCATKNPASPTTHGVLISEGAAAATATTAAGTANQPLVSGGASADPIYLGWTLPTSVTSGGILYFSSTSASATSALLTAHGVVIGGGAGTAPTSTGAGTSGQVLTSNGASADPTFQAASGGGTSVNFWAAPGASTSTVASPAVNTTKLSGFWIGYPGTFNTICINASTADNTANLYDLGIYDKTGATLLAHTGATAGTTLFPATGVKCGTFLSAWVATPQAFLFAITTNCSASCAAFSATGNIMTFYSYAVASSGGGTSGGALNSSLTPSADVWALNLQPFISLH